jgi:serine/threonine protein kinase
MITPPAEDPGVLQAMAEAEARREEGRQHFVEDDLWTRGDRLGGGGMGYVQAAKDALGNDRVVKRVAQRGDPERVADEQATLRHEAESYDRVGAHPNIAETFGYRDQAGGMLAMERLNGGDGDAMMAQLKAAYDARKISHAEYWGAMTSMQRDALSGLEHMGKHGMVHGDMKPANVMYDESGTAKLIDLGTAADIGTPGSEAKSHQVNMTPEWAANNVLDPTNDVYALGQMAHSAVHGSYHDPGRPVDAAGAPVHESEQEKGMRLFGDRTREHQDSRGAKGWFHRHTGEKEKPKSAAEDFINQTVTARGAAPEARRARGQRRHARSGEEGPYQAQYGGKYRLTTEEAAAHPFLNESILEHDEGQAVAARMIADREAGVTYGPKKTDLELAAEGRAASEERVRATRRADTGGVNTHEAIEALTRDDAEVGQMALKASLNEDIRRQVPKARSST